jgi:hypothetical protein
MTNAKPDPRDLVRNMILVDHRPFEDSIRIVREKRAGKDAAFAVAFEDRDGVQRRGVLGMCRHHSDTWQPSGRFMGSAHVTGDRDVWMTWGGWGPGNSHERAVAGGWVADPIAVAARLVDSTGRTLSDELENGVFLFMWKGDLNLRGARLELLDDDNRVTRSGPLRHGG